MHGPYTKEPLQRLFAARRAPTWRLRCGDNRPEERRAAILARMVQLGAAIEWVEPANAEESSGALQLAVDCNVISPNKLELLQIVHPLWRADATADVAFVSAETMEGDGLVPYFFTRLPAGRHLAWERRLAWHATDALSPIFEDLPRVMADDAAVCVAAAEFTCATNCDAYALTTHPGHHASADHFGGYWYERRTFEPTPLYDAKLVNGLER